MRITSKRAADVLGMAITFNGCGRCTSDELREAVSAAIAALREKAEREDPKPLTLEELRQMIGEPVYVVPLAGKPMCAVGENKGEWCVVFSWFNNSEIELEIPGDVCNSYQGEKCGKTWIAYRHKPKEVE